MKKGLSTLFIAAASLFSFIVHVRADATVYWDYDSGFSPRTVVIGPGEGVTWWNIDSYGFDATVTFDNSFSFDLPYLQGQGVVFPADTGTYGYHSNWGDYGAVIVNLPPSVTITNPVNSAQFPAPAMFTIEAAATDTADDYISDVQFYLSASDSTNLIDDVFTAPYTASVTDLAAGTYALMAVATDSRGVQSTNVITITVGASALVNLAAPRFSAGQFLFDVTGLTSGKTNWLQTSTNLTSWQSVQTNVAVSSAMTFTNTPSAGAHFYRILQLP